MKNWDDRGPLECSLPVVTWDFNGLSQKLGCLGFLGTLATGSECSKGVLANIGQGMILCFRWGLSEKKARLRVLQRQETSLRTLANGSECSKR